MKTAFNDGLLTEFVKIALRQEFVEYVLENEELDEESPEVLELTDEYESLTTQMRALVDVVENMHGNVCDDQSVVEANGRLLLFRHVKSSMPYYFRGLDPVVVEYDETWG